MIKKVYIGMISIQNMGDKMQIKNKVILSLSAPIMIIFLSLFLNSCSPSNAPEISAFATTDSSLDPKFSPDNNIFLECDTSGYKFERYNCYKDVSLYARQHGANVEQLFEFIS